VALVLLCAAGCADCLIRSCWRVLAFTLALVGECSCSCSCALLALALALALALLLALALAPAPSC